MVGGLLHYTIKPSPPQRTIKTCRLEIYRNVNHVKIHKKKPRPTKAINKRTETHTIDKDDENCVPKRWD